MSVRDAVGVATLALALLAAACGSEPTDAGRRSPTAEAESAQRPAHATVVRIDAETLEVRSVISVGVDPLILAVAGGRVWTLNFGDGTLSRIDPGTGEVTVLDVGEVAGVASGGEDLWVARDQKVVARLDGATGDEELSFRPASRRLFALRDAGFLAVEFGSVWLTVPGGGGRAPQTLWRIDAESGRVLARIPIGPNPIPPVAAEGAVWVLTAGDRVLTRIDPATNAPLDVEVGLAPWGVAGGAGSVWIGDAGRDREVWRLDPTTGEALARIPLAGEEVRGLAFGRGLLWVATGSGVTVIDPETDKVSGRIQLGEFAPDTGPIGVGYLNGEVWVSIE